MINGFYEFDHLIQQGQPKLRIEMPLTREPTDMSSSIAKTNIGCVEIDGIFVSLK